MLRQWPDEEMSCVWREAGGVTLAGDLDAVVDADGLAVVQVFSLLLAEAGVAEVLEVRHCEKATKFEFSGRVS
jgi:hypothetical protein